MRKIFTILTSSILLGLSTVSASLPPQEVPEFSTITALAALIGSGAGFLVLRKKN